MMFFDIGLVVNRPTLLGGCPCTHPPLPKTYWETFYTQELSRGVRWRLQTLAKPTDNLHHFSVFSRGNSNTTFHCANYMHNAAIIY
jgi:hypothetical protein